MEKVDLGRIPALLLKLGADRLPVAFCEEFTVLATGPSAPRPLRSTVGQVFRPQKTLRQLVAIGSFHGTPIMAVLIRH